MSHLDILMKIVNENIVGMRYIVSAPAFHLRLLQHIDFQHEVRLDTGCVDEKAYFASSLDILVENPSIDFLVSSNTELTKSIQFESNFKSLELVCQFKFIC